MGRGASSLQDSGGSLFGRGGGAGANDKGLPGMESQRPTAACLRRNGAFHPQLCLLRALKD